MTESMYPLKKSLSPDIIREISLETGIEPSFIEKDWYAVKLVSLIAERNKTSDIAAVFSGGTSLSKGYGLIKRFSEDLDFFVNTSKPEHGTVGERRAFRKELIAHITHEKDCFNVDPDAIERGDSHRFFKAPIIYPIAFEKSSLRPHLQLEMTFCEPRLSPIKMPIQSIAASVLGEAPETEIICISPLETAGDKISALSWRVLVRDRKNPKDDPTLIRHLHDLAVLENVISSGKSDFVKITKSSLSQDTSKRGGELIAELSEKDRLILALDKLKQDPLYKDEYERFVMAMSYADDADKIHFDDAHASLNRIIKMYLD
jgi:predicted nucleotidyltransferase component of viral defense system